MRKPMIGLTAHWDSQREGYWMLLYYFRCVEADGGIPVLLPYLSDEEMLRQAVQELDGILLTGGVDVAPGFYGEEVAESCGEICDERDRMEKILFEASLAANKPVLGICRGIQVMNVFLGGTLYQDIPTQLTAAEPACHRPNPPHYDHIHEVEILPQTPLHQMLGASSVVVNSMHHQAIRTLAPQLAAMAFAPDGLVEAVYMPQAHYVLGVQWHPERLEKDAASRALFSDFVCACTSQNSK